MKRLRRARIVATLAASTLDAAGLRALLEAGADVFRFDAAQASPAALAEGIAAVRAFERSWDRPIGVLVDVAACASLPDELDADWLATAVLRDAAPLAALRAAVGTRAWLLARIDTALLCDEARAAAMAGADGVTPASWPTEPDARHALVREARRLGLTVVVDATAPDLAGAIEDGVDAVMTSAPSTPREIAELVRLIERAESAPSYRSRLDAGHTPAQGNTADAVCCSLRRVAALIEPAALITYTDSGATSRRAARERPVAPILSLTPEPGTARRLSLVWGVHPVLVDRLHDVAEMVKWANRTAVIEGYAGAGSDVVIVAGLPFGEGGATNLLHVSRIAGAPSRAAA